ncbi:Eco57I restriction-modification methylase domain-containing protein [Rhodococcus tibetensis]|uniref:site-specific DNA-methyltransferase (adenine-specific) n=1 Tax=Rhodococcus tibetensis TaxID=2965064 RepID=A0ABT1QEB6_9NOCA|nr:Eco57I restriction-modification methylase domain-containing protein [Rhodococcus sp. FXJ9.536]MCQ4120596.1 BREX-1 system adenine-specific DNA-methyltransferase PglX [Rhodococcus sp. FXJ9.536]
MDDTLMTRTEARRVAALAALNSTTQATLGQFFTPEGAAELIASFPKLPESGRLRILDPGAGAGSLAAALVNRALSEAPELEIHVVAVEIDSAVEPFLADTLRDCEVAGATSGTSVSTTLVAGDYIELTTGSSVAENDLAEPFDIVIMNPPYAKLAASSAYRKALITQGADCPNLYAAFLSLGSTSLRPGGQLVAITPRSFANGVYFESFRRELLSRISIDRLHTFESRSTVFSDTGVLQENIILCGTRGGDDTSEVVLTTSRGHTDAVTITTLPYTAIIRPNDPHLFLRVPGTAGDTSIAEAMVTLPAMLPELRVQVSTGRVVDFRSRANLCDADTHGAVPLIYPGNVRGGVIEWPREIRKNQGFVPLADGKKLLLPSGVYVVVKRFSAKEERRRIVAALWDPEVNGDTSIAFENHLNIFHCNGAGLDRDFAIGLSWWLNSSIVDQYFRTFSGHTQVNATDLRSLRYPARDDLSALGRSRSSMLPLQEDIDDAVAAFTTPVEEVA